MSESTTPTKKKRVQRCFGRVQFSVTSKSDAGMPDVTRHYTATMNKSGVTIRRRYSHKPQVLTFDKILDALAGQYTFKL